MKTDNSTIVKFKVLLITLAVIAALAALYHGSRYCCACIIENLTEKPIKSLSELLLHGVKEKYGFIIPDNAHLIKGNVLFGKDSSALALYFSVELDGLEGYDAEMDHDRLFSVMHEASLNNEKVHGYYSNDPYYKEASTWYTGSFSNKFIWWCSWAEHAEVWLSEPEDGKLFVFLLADDPESRWYE